LTLVSLADGYFPIRTGDRVRFERIDEREFARLKGERLPGSNEPSIALANPSSSRQDEETRP